jgi:predicted acyltransferase
LLGVLAGLLLRNPRTEDRRKLTWLLAGGTLCLVAGLLWSVQFPLIKKIWTSSYVLVAGAAAHCCWDCFIWIVDIRKPSGGVRFLYGKGQSDHRVSGG